MHIGELCHVTIIPSSSKVNLDLPKPNVVLQFRVEVCTKVCKPLSESSSNVWEVFRASIILFTKRLLRDIWDLFNIPDDIELSCAQQSQTVEFPTYGCTAIHKLLMDIGLRVDFHHFFCNVFFAFNIALI